MCRISEENVILFLTHAVHRIHHYTQQVCANIHRELEKR